MKNISITLTVQQADALCTALSILDKGSDLNGLYNALSRQFSRPYLYRLVPSERSHDTYGMPLVQLVRKGS